MASNRKINKKIETFDNNITNRGNVPTSIAKKGKKYTVGPILLGIFIFIVIGSVVIQILNILSKSKSY
ncbi:hypothetical protein YYC_05040 [Plasmodium yoelii 17X]|uniref:Ribosome associated membrane protein RAMP4 n=4 Tax=Plasmodium yoelii TaxID=5861 RepID=A0AAF0B042_PLAYO|nr:uncharacterized protein PY17X_0316500 [Plasmodium yoelii]EAA16367.1 Arabidopsis thaliana F17L21.12-related [Plasmodium yoelii yoelii]ETB57239.1 hypothetical protein YYC_05040 [Plasmodium yoelii 17X]WBY55093.1 ribosome associated membrane protein RAMP4 [Plasmodium yoelii yoelii]CDU16349.1 ribosome associated membrane protein RAMP4, putative [Plasmodium yoelii]VTZ72655.1 ribosome associated membrane protein RAMP4, putative [Plasmodium yoelii]|eukprot:XP_724802.1 uncharacterized protein PY17X_0316500 [Plasmodium yoelii]